MEKQSQLVLFFEISSFGNTPLEIVHTVFVAKYPNHVLKELLSFLSFLSGPSNQAVPGTSSSHEPGL